MLLLSEHQLKCISRSQETWGKYLVHYYRKIFGYCKNARICTLFPHILLVISGTKSDRFLPIFLRLCSHWIIFWRLNYYLLHITTTVESIYQCMFLQKIISFFNLKQKQASRGNIKFSVPVTFSVTKYFCPIWIQQLPLHKTSYVQDNSNFSHLQLLLQVFLKDHFTNSWQAFQASGSVVPMGVIHCTLFLPSPFIQLEFWMHFVKGTTPYSMRNRRLSTLKTVFWRL